MINEDFLKFVWQSLRFNVKNLLTTEGKEITLLDRGYLNSNAGPDFLSARIVIDNIQWIGSVEVHVKSSDWMRHKHQVDPNYENVILHVVLQEDEIINNQEGNRIPCLELNSRIDQKTWRNYKLLKKNHSYFPCENQFDSVPDIVFTSAIEKSVLSE